MSVITTGSPDITVLDSKIVADLCAGKFYVDASPSSYIGSGADNVLGANVKIVSPHGVTVKEYGPDYEINPGLSGGMDTVIAFNIPTIAGGYQLGAYKIYVELFDSEGNSWVIEKSVKICAPNPKDKTKKYGLLSAKLDGSCTNGKLYVMVDTPPNYSGKTVSSQVSDLTLEYPTASGVEPEETTFGNYSVQLYEGVYLLEGEICAEYSMGDNVYVKVKYVVKKKKEIRCVIDLCCVFGALKDLREKLDQGCTQEEKEEISGIIFDALHLVWLIEQSAACGEDSSDFVTRLEKLLGCSCTCNCAEGTPIINNSPTSDLVLDGCGFDFEQVGLTKTYTINNYTYTVEVEENSQSFLTISEATLEDCTKKQVATFNITNVYNAIKALANGSNTEADSWAAVINKSLRDINPSCLGLTDLQWQNKTLAQKFDAVFTKMCECCGCDASISDVEVQQSGGDGYITWTNNGSVFMVQVFVDGIYMGSVLSPLEEFKSAGFADGNQKTLTLLPCCAGGAIGTKYENDELLLVGCPEIAPPSLATNLYEDVECPFDLITEAGLDVEEIEVHNANNTLPSTLVGDPFALSDGIYYVFKKQGAGVGNCFSTGVKVTITCATDGSCTKPQNLQKYLGIAAPGGILQYFRFDSAAYPPPANSYTAKKRLAADPDEPGSYTTLDAPVWNASASKWQFSDLLDASDDVNKKWVYRVESNCGGSPATTPYVEIEFVYFKCSSLSTTPHSDSIDYSYPTTIANDIDKYEISIYDSTGATLIHTDTHLPAFSNPITGTFDYLDPDTTYLIKVKACIGSTCNTGTCESKNETTLSES